MAWHKRGLKYGQLSYQCGLAYRQLLAVAGWLAGCNQVPLSGAAESSWPAGLGKLAACCGHGGLLGWPQSL